MTMDLSIITVNKILFILFIYRATTNMMNSDVIVQDFLMNNAGIALTVGQLLSLRSHEKMFVLEVKSLEGIQCY